MSSLFNFLLTWKAFCHYHVIFAHRRRDFKFLELVNKERLMPI